jgi:hypothetical protein
MRRIAIILILTLFTCPICGAEIKFDVATPGKLKILLDGRPVADYVFQDPEIPRPYFARLHAPSGIQVSRSQPPDPNLDVADHPLFHPGLWLTFGALSGNDYWRNSAKTEFVEFTEAPLVTVVGGQFTARFRYLDQNDSAKTVCEELFSCRIMPRPAGTLIVWDSTFSGDNEFEFGDQEEMGLGIRLATPLRSEPQARGDIPPGTGTILDAEGRKNGAEIWGKSAPWCDYSGSIDGNRVGATILCHPNNFRSSWFHARDYGLLVANPFGRKAFHLGDESRVVVKPGEKFRLRYGILLHGDAEQGLNEAYQDYVNLTDDAK